MSVPRIVPNLQDLYQDVFGDKVAIGTLTATKKLVPPATDDQQLLEIFNPVVRQSLSDLLKHFMYYYAYEFPLVLFS